MSGSVRMATESIVASRAPRGSVIRMMRDGSLLALVRDPASGQMFQLTASDWRGAVFWRDIISPLL
jgi:hypothetical protein